MILSFVLHTEIFPSKTGFGGPLKTMNASRSHPGRISRFSQRRTVMFPGGVSNQWGKALVNFEKGSIEYEPGFVPPSHATVLRHVAGTWKGATRGGMKQIYPRPQRTKSFHDEGKFTPAYEQIPETLPYSEWDALMPLEVSPSVGLEWQDLDAAQEAFHSSVLSPDLEAVGLHPHIIAALHKIGIENLTRPQYESLYYLRKNNSMLLASSPASGKSSAVIWHILNKLLKEYPNAPFSTVYIVPTEALAKQVLRWFVTLGKLVGVLHDKDFCLCIASKDLERNFEEVMQHRPSVLIGTPERIGDLIHTKHTPLWHMTTTTLQRIVVDEADAVLNPYDQDAIGNVLLYMLRRGEKFSAHEIGRVGDVPTQLICVTSTAHNSFKDHLFLHWLQDRDTKIIENHFGRSLQRNVVGAAGGMCPRQNNAAHLETRNLMADHRALRYDLFGGMSLQRDIEHVSVLCPGDRLSSVGPAIKNIIAHQNYFADSPTDTNTRKAYFRGLIIVETAEDAAKVAKSLYANGLEGRVGRLENPLALKSYADGTLPVLITLASNVRGMDLPYLTHVICCLPIQSPADYVRYAGRVGRAGRSGVCYVFQKPSETKFLQRCEERLGFKFLKTRFEKLTTDSKTMPGFLRGVQPARQLLEGESKDFSVNPNILSGTSNADVKLIKSLVVDDPKYLDTLEEDAEPYHLVEFDESRNYLTATGQKKPVIDKKLWSAGTSPATLYNKDELALLHRHNKYAYKVRPEPESAVVSGMVDRTQINMLGGSMNPDTGTRYGIPHTGPTRGGRRLIEDISEYEGVQFDAQMLSKLVDSRTGQPLAQSGNYHKKSNTKKNKPLTR